MNIGTPYTLYSCDRVRVDTFFVILGLLIPHKLGVMFLEMMELYHLFLPNISQFETDLSQHA